MGTSRRWTNLRDRDLWRLLLARPWMCLAVRLVCLAVRLMCLAVRLVGRRASGLHVLHKSPLCGCQQRVSFSKRAALTRRTDTPDTCRAEDKRNGVKAQPFGGRSRGAARPAAAPFNPAEARAADQLVETRIAEDNMFVMNARTFVDGFERKRFTTKTLALLPDPPLAEVCAPNAAPRAICEHVPCPPLAEERAWQRVRRLCSTQGGLLCCWPLRRVLPAAHLAAVAAGATLTTKGLDQKQATVGP